ncbi:MAG TPA: TraR/DksA C4-type zinc finger protein [Acidimicrobiales bacterium]|nr:TraR/DksA C4-type zinc finger protein [Acidimicrobiales bacterium]
MEDPFGDLDDLEDLGDLGDLDTVHEPDVFGGSSAFGDPVPEVVAVVTEQEPEVEVPAVAWEATPAPAVATDDADDGDASADDDGDAEEAGFRAELDRLGAVEAELVDVELALRRLDEGSYGRCEVCEAAIDDAHLAQAPAARFCRAHLPITLG